MTDPVAPDTDDDDRLIPVRMVNAWTFCPRLFWLEHVEGVFADNEHTLEGQTVHQRVDQPGGRLPAPGEDEDAPPWHARSLWLSSPSLGVSGKLDLVEADGGDVMPVDTKKGKPGPEGLWPADQIQLTLQAMLLREAGYRCERIAAWYHAERRRVELPLTAAMEAAAREAVAGARHTMAGEQIPAPLIDSPKCRGCSLNIVCLPDEHRMLSEEPEPPEVARRVVPERDDHLPLYIQSPRARISLSDNCLIVQEKDSEDVRVGIDTISHVCIFGTAQVTTQALQACMRKEKPVFYFTTGGWFLGRVSGMGSRHAELRRAQFAAVGGPKALAVGKSLVGDKIANCRTFLRRNGGSEAALVALRQSLEQSEQVDNPNSLLGAEGNAARQYFAALSELLCRDEPKFAMVGRSRRPPRDRSNAMLSFGYSLLAKDCSHAIAMAGLDVQQGLYHTAHHGRPAMALDLMEPFRPLVVDSMVLLMIRRREITAEDFVETGQAIAMKEGARRALIRAYERRMNESVTHPTFGYKISYRQVLGVQARLIARYLNGEIAHVPPFRTR